MTIEENIIGILLESNEEKKEKVLAYCKKKINPLEEMDQKKGTDYVHTLAVYLENGNDLLHSAEKMYVHRNTMINRMKKITDLLGVDINDPKERVELNNVFLF